jgi:hypothetical protein
MRILHSHAHSTTHAHANTQTHGLSMHAHIETHIRTVKFTNIDAHTNASGMVKGFLRTVVYINLSILYINLSILTLLRSALGKNNRFKTVSDLLRELYGLRKLIIPKKYISSPARDTAG